MTMFNRYTSDDIRTIRLDVIGGKERVAPTLLRRDLYLNYSLSMPGIVWFERNGTEYEVVDYRWDGPRYQDMVIQETTGKSSFDLSNRKGRVAGAVIGTILAPGIGTVIGAAVGTGKKDKDLGRRTVSHIETEEVPVVAYMFLRDLDNDDIVTLSFECTSALDAQLRNEVAVNLTALDYDIPQPVVKEEPEAKETTGDVLAAVKGPERRRSHHRRRIRTFEEENTAVNK